MGCCHARAEEKNIFNTQTPSMETQIDITLDDVDLLKRSRSQISLKQIMQKPPTASETPCGKMYSVLNLYKAFDNENNSICFLVGLKNEHEIENFDSCKLFETKIFYIREEWQTIILDYFHAMKEIMKKPLEGVVWIFNYEILADDHFLLHSMVKKNMINRLNGFNLLIYKECLNISFSYFVEEKINGPGLLDENLLLNILFNIAKNLKILKKIGIEFDDLNENYFFIDLKSQFPMKFDPTQRKFCKLNKEYYLRTLKVYCAPEIKFIPSDADESLVYIDFLKNDSSHNKNKSYVYSVGVLILRTIIGKELKTNEKLCVNSLKKQYHELLTIKYPKLWYLLELMIEENPIKRINLEELLEKSQFISCEESFLFTNISFEFEPEKELNNIDYSDYSNCISLIEGNILIFQRTSAIKLLEELKFYLNKTNLFIFDDKFIEIALKKGTILLNEESFALALEEFNYIEQALSIKKPSPEIMKIKQKAKFSQAICYKYLNKLTKCFELLYEICEDVHANEEIIINCYNETVDIYIGEKQFAIAKKIMEKTNNFFIERNEQRNANSDIEKLSLLADFYELYSKIYMLSEEDFVKSLEYIKKAHQIRKKIYSSEHMIIIKSYKLMALGFLNVGEIKEASKAINKNLNLLKIRESLIYSEKESNKFRNLRGESLKIQSKIQLDLGELDKAEKTYKEVIEINEEIFGFYSDKMAKELQGLANFYSSLGYYNKAIETFKIASEVLKNIYGENSLESAQNMLYMAEFYEENGKYSEAVEVLLDSLKIKIEKFGGINEYMIEDFKKISKNYEFLGFYSKAVEFAEKCLELLQEKLGLNKQQSNMTNLSNFNNSKEKTPVKSPLFKNEIIEETETDKVLLFDDEIIGKTTQVDRNSDKKRKKNALIETLFRLGTLYGKMGDLAKSKIYFDEQKKINLL